MNNYSFFYHYLEIVLKHVLEIAGGKTIPNPLNCKIKYLKADLEIYLYAGLLSVGFFNPSACYLTMRLPSFGPTLRLASPKDIRRIGLVAGSGFRSSPVFDWERPHHEQYPEDTLLSYQQTFASYIKSPKYMVLVVLDKYDPDEHKKTKLVLPPNNGGVEIPAEGDEVVVGVACWELEPGSKLIGQFPNDTGTNYARMEVRVSNSPI